MSLSQKRKRGSERWARSRYRNPIQRYTFPVAKPPRVWLTIPQTYSEEKGFAFIVRCVDATEIFGHKREFPQGVEPYVGQPVSFAYEITEKGGTAKKVLDPAWRIRA